MIDRRSERHPRGVQVPANEHAATEQPAPSGASRRWELTCADCGTHWSVGALDLLAGDAWLRCPTCRRAA